jgi:hypothetical protein
MDRYTKSVLTVIAAALVYLCVVLTPWPAAHAQRATQRPGDFVGPGEIVIVGWKAPEPVSITAQQPLAVTASAPLQVTGRVTTERSSGRADRVVIAGWEELASADRAGRARAIESGAAGLPVTATVK